jgi:hypothetical protein
MPRLIVIPALTFALAIGVVVLASESNQKKPKGERPVKTSKAPEIGNDASDKKHAQQEKVNQDEKGDRWMLFKLTSSQAMFAELTRGNLKGVAKHARASQAIDALEYWLRGREFRARSEYHKQLNNYQFAVRELARHPEDGNIDEALESWLDINRSCVQCHKLLRDPVQVDPSKHDAKPAE